MSCYHPHYAIDFGINTETGKHKIKFLPQRPDSSLQQLRYKYGEDSILSLPCGHCIGCTLDYAKEWAVRCCLESFYYKDQTWFLTLTYDDEHLPEKASKKDFQDFIRDVRRTGYKVRYFGCGEFGSLTNRFHLHILLFGLPLTDLKVYKKSRDGFLFTSKTISDIWKKGFCTVAIGNFQTAGYIARYCIKKRMVRNDGEFILMSKKPGLGQRYFEEHQGDITEYDRLVGNFGGAKVSSVPRYFDKLAEKYGIDISSNKQKRLDLSKQLTRSDLLRYVMTDEEMLYAAKEDIHSKKVRFLVRGM